MTKHRSGRACPRNRSVIAPAGVPEHRSGRACSRNRSAVALAGVPEHRSGRACSHNRSTVAPAGVPEHQSKRGYPCNRSAIAPTGVPKYQQECRSTNKSAEAPRGRPLIHFSVLGSHMIICISELITYLNHIMCS